MTRRILRIALCALSAGVSLVMVENLCASEAASPSSAAAPSSSAPSSTAADVAGAEALGIQFVDGSTTSVIVERQGRKYLVNLDTRIISEVKSPAPSSSLAQQPPDPPSAAEPKQVATKGPQQAKVEVYEAGDDYVFSLPSGRRLERHGFYVNFDHRFAFNTAFEGKARGHVLSGLDDFSISSFGFRYGVNRNLSLAIYRSPSVIARPIQLTAGYNLLDEHDGQPLNAAVRFSVEGQNDFSKNFTEDFEGIFSRSVTSRMQIYFVPTVSLQSRRLVPPQRRIENPPPNLPGFNTFALGIGGALDVRPTVALVAEVIPTLVNGRDLGIHRPAYSFGIQKKIWRHAFTFGFSNSPGTTVSQRAATRATLLNDPSADTPAGLFVGFDLTRQIY